MCEYCEGKQNFRFSNRTSTQKFGVNISIHKNQLRVAGYGSGNVHADDFYEGEGVLAPDTSACSGGEIFEIKYCPMCGRKLDDYDNPIIVFFIIDNPNSPEHSPKLSEFCHRYLSVEKIFPIDKNVNVEFSLEEYEDFKKTINCKELEQIVERIKNHSSETLKKVMCVTFCEHYWTPELIIKFLTEQCEFPIEQIVNGDDTKNLEIDVNSALTDYAETDFGHFKIF